MADGPPPLIYANGDVSLLSEPMAAVVGARNRSAIGQKLTRQIASDLGREGFVIASGLARGIYTAVLERGTVAALAGGIDNVYPLENGEVARGGRATRLATELNACRLQTTRTGLSAPQPTDLGHLGRRGGGGRSALGAATNKLLMDGAGLVTCATDIIDVLTPILGRDIELPPDKGQAFDTESGKPPRMDISRSERELVIDALSFAQVDIDEIIRTTRLPASQVQVILLELDLARYLKRHGSQLVSLGETERDNATRTDFGLKPSPAVYGVFLDDQFQRIRRGR